jgi:hypothetical protein
MRKKEALQEAHTKGIRDQLEKQFTREREYTKRFAEEREYAVHQCAEKVTKRADHLAKKQKDDNEKQAKDKESEAKALTKLNEHNKKRAERL